MRILTDDTVTEVKEVQVSCKDDDDAINVHVIFPQSETSYQIARVEYGDIPQHEPWLVANHIREKLLKQGYFDFDNDMHLYLGRIKFPKKRPTPEPQK